MLLRPRRLSACRQTVHNPSRNETPGRAGRPAGRRCIIVHHRGAILAPLPRTCTLDSGKLIFIATSSRINISGYLVFENKPSRTSNCARVKVVLSLRCFLGLPSTENNPRILFPVFSFSISPPFFPPSTLILINEERKKKRRHLSRI